MPSTSDDRLPRTLLVTGILIVAAAVVGLAALQYLMPPSFDTRAGVNRAGIEHFRTFIPIPDVPPLAASSFGRLSMVLIVTAWTGYALILFSSYRRDVAIGRYALPAISGLAVLVALLFPPSLSTDIYAYAGWGRMSVIHGLSPYAHSLRTLADLGDPAGLVAPVPASTTHGSVWIAIVWLLIGVLENADLSVQIVALKLVAAVALVAAAFCAGEVARFYDPRRARLATLAIGFNPLFVIEGPGNGHNDVLMVALMLGGLAACQMRRSLVGYLLLGLSAGIKFVSAAIVPWIVCTWIAGLALRNQFRKVFVALALVVMPAMAAYVAFGAGAEAFDGITEIFQRQIGGSVATQAVGNADPAETHSAQLSPSRNVLPRVAAVLTVYAALSFEVWRTSTPGLALSFWALFSLVLIFLGAPVAFPWYLIWPFSTSVTRWDRLGRSTTIACIGLSVVILIMHYTVPYAR